MSIRVRWKLFFMVAVCLAALFASGCSLLPKEEEELAPPLVKPIKQNFTTAVVKKASIEETIKGVATLQPYVLSYHQFKGDGGRIKKIFVRAGDRVKKGGPLIQLEIDNLDLDIKYKELDMEKAKLGLHDAIASHNEGLIKVKSLEYDIAKLSYERTVEKLADRTMTADIDGEVTFVTDIEPPNYVNAYENLVVVADTRKLRLVVEKDDAASLMQAEVGMPAEATWNDALLTAKVVQTPNSAPITDDPQLRERNSKSLYLELEKVPDDAEIGDNMEVKIITKKKDNTLVIPAQALRNFMTRNYVQILDGERISEADVEVGIKSATEVEILSGISEGQNLILK